MARRRTGTAEKLEDWLFANQADADARTRCKQARQDVGGITDFDAQYAGVLEQVKNDAALGGAAGRQVDADVLHQRLRSPAACSRSSSTRSSSTS